MMKLNYLSGLLLCVSLLSGCTLKDQNGVFIKQVSFKENSTLDEKVKMAAHVVPSQQQLEWQKLEMTAFIHFTVNTFTDMEWGHGDESPEVFNPSELDVRQWAKTLSESGMKMVIITAKHHDGFCLWPTKTTRHSVVSSPWKEGKGDVVKELKEACDEFGLKFGVYLSPWDRNAECYGDSPRYNELFKQQLTELLTWYGKVDEVWFDGACGEGPNGKKQVYDWEGYYATIKKYQPNAVTAIKGEDVRWVGTETGYGRATEWSVTAYAPGGRPEMVAINERLGLTATSNDLGSRAVIEKADHLFWYPAEVDVSIRPGWFYHQLEDDKVKSLAKMVDIYFNSVGMNAVLLLNIPPDKRGLIHEYDVARLREFKAYLDETFDENLLLEATCQDVAAAKKAIDDDEDTYWSIDNQPATATFKLPQPQTINVVMLQEYIAKGQRVELFRVEAKVEGGWTEVAKGTTIGYKRLFRFPNVITDEIRVSIEQARDGALINSIGVYASPEILSEPVIKRNRDGLVTISTETPHPTITYTLDGSEPTASSARYRQPLALPDGGLLKARAFIDNFKVHSSVVTQQYDICSKKWNIVDVSAQVAPFNAINAIDGDPDTMWHTPWGDKVPTHPHYIAIDLGEKLTIKGFTYTPRSDDNKSGTIFKYVFYISQDGDNWQAVKTSGEFSNIKNNPVRQDVRFATSYPARYIKLESTEGVFNEAWVSVGEMGIITK